MLRRWLKDLIGHCWDQERSYMCWQIFIYDDKIMKSMNQQRNTSMSQNHPKLRIFVAKSPGKMILMKRIFKREIFPDCLWLECFTESRDFWIWCRHFFWNKWTHSNEHSFSFCIKVKVTSYFVRFWCIFSSTFANQTNIFLFIKKLGTFCLLLQRLFSLQEFFI